MSEQFPNTNTEGSRELYDEAGRLTQFGREVVDLAGTAVDPATRQNLVQRLENNRVGDAEEAQRMAEASGSYRSKAAETRRSERQLLENPIMKQSGADFASVLGSVDSAVAGREAALKQDPTATNRLELDAARTTAAFLHEAHERGESLDTTMALFRGSAASKDKIADRIEESARDGKGAQE